ncbi:3-(3-hydroxyphenyl)propionate hydroxylase [Sphaerisporangium rufum]|uniref:3-(3-hydroxyphenyl)propionate hydroxylase n=1 Tax=Sphaerisporangium rufum TaxID=1381558 RepID=A0A919R5M7_9ACTN|nr:FAD-dependent monooxygenase [Sphaerisporangium rufum]GII77572.1 3-(3-hydroxyphenyl)propionate hydroxylase [Sphaerisporangium rufum]
MTDIEVLIAGAGPTGLTLACELARRGVRFRIVDRADRFPGGSRADGVQPRTLEVFDDLGIIDPILAAGDLGTEIRAYQGREVVWTGRMSEPAEPTPAVPYPNLWFVPQFHTERILRDRLAALGGRVETATELGDFTQDEDGVTAVLATAGAAENVRARYLVGADGARSTVRKRLGVPFPGETDDSGTVLFADARVDGVSRDHGRIWQAGDGVVALIPLAGSELFVVTTRPPENAAEPIRDHLQRQITELSGRADIVVREVTWHTTWRANTRLAERFRDGRVFLAGDAGHVHPPTGGQGMNTGIQDAYNLGWKLATPSPPLLDSYQPERMAAARAALDLSTRLLDKHRRGDADAHVRGPEVHQLTLGYRGGSLSRDDRAEPGAVRAGDRAPDAPVTMPGGRPGRLFDLFRGPHWTLLGFGAAQAGTVAALGERYGPALRAHTVVRPGEPAGGAAVLDGDGHAHAGYDAAGGTLMLVRPDGYVGLAAHPGTADQVIEYWTALYGASTPSSPDTSQVSLT